MALRMFAVLAHVGAALTSLIVIFAVYWRTINFIGLVFFGFGVFLSIATFRYAKTSATAHTVSAAAYLAAIGAYSGMVPSILAVVLLPAAASIEAGEEEKEEETEKVPQGIRGT